MSRRMQLISALLIVTMVIVGIVVVIQLRGQNLAGLQPQRDTGAGLTADQLQGRADAKELEKKLPKDLRTTWTPEFQKEMEDQERSRMPISSSTR